MGAPSCGQMSVNVPLNVSSAHYYPTASLAILSQIDKAGQERVLPTRDEQDGTTVLCHPVGAPGSSYIHQAIQALSDWQTISSTAN